MNAVFVNGQIEIWAWACASGWGPPARTCMRAYISLWTSKDTQLPAVKLGPTRAQNPPVHAFRWPFNPIRLPFFRFRTLLPEVLARLCRHWRLSLLLLTMNRCPWQQRVGTSGCYVKFAMSIAFVTEPMRVRIVLKVTQGIELSIDEKTPYFKSCCASASL